MTWLLLIVLIVMAACAHAASPSPISWQGLAELGPALLVALLGGLVAFISKVRAGDARRFNFVEFVGDMVTSAISGLVPYGTGNSTELANLPAALTYMPAIGRQFVAWLENGAGADTQTWYGDNGGLILQSGISGEIMG